MAELNTLFGWEAEIDAWLRVGLIQEKPVRLVETLDVSEGWEKRNYLIFEMPTGQYIGVAEVGCSCYSYYDADIEFFPNEAAAQTAMSNFEKDYGREYQ